MKSGSPSRNRQLNLASGGSGTLLVCVAPEATALAPEFRVVFDRPPGGFLI